MDQDRLLREFQDYVAPRLDTYEQALYLYALRHSRVEGREEVVIGFKSARKAMAFGIGEKGKPMSEATCYSKLRSLAEKGLIVILSSEREGTRLRVAIPRELPWVAESVADEAVEDIERADFFEVAANRPRILAREGGKCFYCLTALDDRNYVIEHVTSRPTGDNGYRNVVAACRACNNSKGSGSAEDHLRGLLRRHVLSHREFEGRIETMRRLRAGELIPPLA